MSGLLDRINEPNDIKNIEPENYNALAEEIRQFLINSVSVTGGHLASNLGAVELTMALHIALDFPQDKLIWDVGHQSYTHKLLTGRREGFESLRSFGGMSGFPKQKESDCDAFDTGHSSTSLSAALGYAQARNLLGEDYTVAAVIGDGSLTGGMAYEALNNASRLQGNLIYILNDNKMSISENVGGLTQHLSVLRASEDYIELKGNVERRLQQIPHLGNSVARNMRKSKDSIRHLLVKKGGFFEDFGVRYIGPVDGHNVAEMVQIFNGVKKLKHPVLVHVVTKKGKGYLPAEQNPSAFHGIGPFDVETGKTLASSSESYTSVFANKICRMATEHEDIVTVCAAMPDGTGLTKFKKYFPERFFDVGIAEQHAVTFAAGMASAGVKPFVCIYSSFLQRAYDQIIHDVCIQKLPVVFCIDRAGLVGADGETHQGIFDISFLSAIPNMTVMSPKNGWEVKDMLDFAYNYNAPIALRYPRGAAWDGLKEFRAPIEYGKFEKIYDGSEVAVIAAGSMVKDAIAVINLLKEKGIDASFYNARFVWPLDEEKLTELAESHKLIVTMEENVLKGGFGEACEHFFDQSGKAVKTLTIGIPDCFVEHGTVNELKKSLGMDAEAVTARILELI